MRRICFNHAPVHVHLASALAVFALLSASPVDAQEADSADANVPAADSVLPGDAPLFEGDAEDEESGPLADEDETVLIEAKVQPILNEKDFAAVPAAVHPQLEAINAALAQLSEAVQATTDAAALRAAAKTAMSEIQASRRVLEYHGLRVEEREGALIDIVDHKIGEEASSALGLIIGDAVAIERGLRYCLELVPNTCHQRLRGDLEQLSQFDASRDLALPENKTRIASTPTLGLGALVVAYLPDPRKPIPLEPVLTGDDDLDATRRTQTALENEEAMQDFFTYRTQIQQARIPHVIVNHALATGDLVDLITFPRKFTNAEGKEDKIERDPTSRLRGASDPSDEVSPNEFWAFVEKLDEEDELYRRSLVGSAAATATE